MNSYQTIHTGEVRQVLRSFAAFSARVCRFLLYAAGKNIFLLLLLCALIGGGGFYKWKSQPVYFESEMVCSFNNMHKKTFGEMVHRLDLLAKTGSVRELARILGITEAQARSIKGFTARNIAGSPLQEDITTEKLPMYFGLQASDRTVFPLVEQGLLRYLNGTPYQELRVKLEREKISERISYLDGTIHKLDSVIDAYAYFLRRTTAITDTAAGFSNVAALFKHQEELENKKLDEIKLSRLLHSVDLIYGFAPTDNPKERSRTELLKYLLGALGFSLVVVVLKELLAYGR